MKELYLIDGKPATLEEVKAQEAENKRIMDITDTDEFLKEAANLKFIFCGEAAMWLCERGKWQ